MVNPFDGLEGLPLLKRKIGPVSSYVLRECLQLSATESQSLSPCLIVGSSAAAQVVHVGEG